MQVRRTRRICVGAAALAALPALAVAGCATEIDNSKAESLIRNQVASGYKVKSVSCPSGVTAKAGRSFNCNLTLTSVSDGSVHSGTVTIHMTDSSGRVTIGPNDFHLH